MMQTDVENMNIQELIACILVARSDLPEKDRTNGICRKVVERHVDCDTRRLYGSIDDAVKYLREIQQRYPKATLDEHWSGYEDMELRFIWEDLQTDDEYRDDMYYLLRHEQYDRQLRNEDRETKRRSLLAEKNRIDKQLKELG